jgi:ribosomal protein S18 acetylase RimI-like enzyme
MFNPKENQFTPASTLPLALPAPVGPQVHPLVAGAEAEVIAFLAARPVHTVALASAIRDHSLVSPRHRGHFYCVRDEAGQLEGVALIGHATLIEAQTERALAAFAHLARRTPHRHLIMGERARIACFWQHFATDGTNSLRFAASEILFTLDAPPPTNLTVVNLRQADIADLDLIVPVQAELALAESGIDPLVVDPDGFRERCARRITQGRTWVVVEQGRLLFKAELQAVTPEVIYLEGIYVHESMRGEGFGVHCLSQLCRTLLSKTSTLCLLVNEQNRPAQHLYGKIGFRQQDCYDTIFLSDDN